MLTPLHDPTPTRAARLAGVAYVALFALAIFANFFVRVRLVDPGDATTTFENLASDEGLLRLALVAFLAVFVLDVVVAWALHHVLRPAGVAISALAAWFRVVSAVFLGMASVFLFVVLELLDGGAPLAGLGRAPREVGAVLALGAFNATWLIGLVSFGIHLVLVGVILVRSAMAPRVLGALLAVAGVAYVLDTGAYSLLGTYADHEAAFTAMVAIPSVAAELWFTGWLLSLGRRRRRPPAVVSAAVPVPAGLAPGPA